MKFHHAMSHPQKSVFFGILIPMRAPRTHRDMTGFRHQ